MKSIAVALAATAALFLNSCEKSEIAADVGFAESTFSSLVRGDSSVASEIDWETFNSLGVPVGPQYIAIENAADKESFKTGFITQFSAAFRENGGSIESFSNWREASHDDNHTVVMADSAKGSLQLTVSERDSIKRLSAIKIVK